jgi:hypothetical protein
MWNIILFYRKRTIYVDYNSGFGCATFTNMKRVVFIYVFVFIMFFDKNKCVC